MEDKVMGVIRSLHTRSGLTLQELGVRMGYDPKIAEDRARRFLRSNDPRASELRRFARAMSVPVEALFVDQVDTIVDGPIV